jgi:hypothetical protein
VLLLSLRGRLQTLRAISNPAVEASLGDPASHLYSSTEEQRFRDPVSAYLTCFSPRSNSQRWPQELRGASQTLVEEMPVFSVALGVRVDVGTELTGPSSIVQTMDTCSHLLDGVAGDGVDGLEEAMG